MEFINKHIYDNLTSRRNDKIISSNFSDRFKIPNSKKPRLERSSALASVNGQPLTEMGKAVFNITLGSLTLDSGLIVKLFGSNK
jgi:hypothetical protein